MKVALPPVNVFHVSSPQVDQNKRFVAMVHINRMFDDGGG